MQRKASVVVVLGTGGTIAGVASSPTEHLAYASAQLGVETLMASIPALEGVVIETEQVAQLDSKDMDFGTWRRLALRLAHHVARPEVAGVVVTHGTDTLEETAYFLSRVIDTTMPVVLTAAMRPATSSEADGPRNLADALVVAMHGSASAAESRPLAGVVVVIAGEVHAASDVRKVHPRRLAAFSSGEQGALASISNGALTVRRALNVPLASIDPRALPESDDAWPWIEIVTSVAGADGRSVRLLADAGIDGIVVAATGNGTLHHKLADALLEVRDRGIAVLRSTRCLDGTIIDPDASAQPIPSAGDLTPVKARVDLLLTLLSRRRP